MNRISKLECRISNLETIGEYRKIQDCPQCKHKTLQYYNYPREYVCLTCGSKLEYGVVLKVINERD